MRTNLDLPDELVRRARSIARRRGSSLEDLVCESLRRLLAAEYGSARGRMTAAPIKLPPGQTIPLCPDHEPEQFMRQTDFE
jgi:plasmid stability protein